MIIEAPQWPHPIVYPKPAAVAGVAAPVIDLCGTWSLAHNPQGDYWLSSQTGISWTETVVPGDLSAARKRRGTWAVDLYVYKREIQIPADFSDQRILLRFEGSYGLTRVWIDGHLAATHEDGFITWYCDITAWATPGQPCLVVIGIENYNDEVSGFNAGGLVRGLSLVALPPVHLTRLHSQTRFAANGRDASLELLLGTAGQSRAPLSLDVTLTGPQGDEAHRGTYVLAAGSDQTLTIQVGSVQKWDAEHPHLYRLEAHLVLNGQITEVVRQQVGFREIHRAGNRLYVNGDEVKLRGVCRHDISPHNGRTVTDDELRADVRLFKEANINYIRTSHYPPSEAFLDLCDEVGMYVEDEVGLAFIGRSLKYTEKSPAHTKRYLGFFSALVERDRSHPSVLIWSLANESFYGPNFAAINAWAHQEDPSRPTKFSYPMTMQEEDEPVDIWSVHYPNHDSDLAKKHDNVSVGFLPGRDVPVLHDECIHVPCYNRGEHRRDPAVRNFWGESIRRFWDNIWQTPGALGGAIWAGIDEVSFAAPGRILEWGIIDVWRRPKPEYHLTKKAYSPVHVLNEHLAAPSSGLLEVPVENRFCHTNFNELTITWRCGEAQGQLRGPDLAPGHTGALKLPRRDWQPRDRVELTWTDAYGLTIDAHELTLDQEPARLPSFCGQAPELDITDSSIQVSGAGFHLTWNRATGQIREAVRARRVVLKGGPDLHLVGADPGPWTCISCTAEIRDNLAVITSRGRYDAAGTVTWITRVDARGLVQVRVRLDDWHLAMPQSMKIRVGIHPGGLDEWGISFLADRSADAVSWTRETSQSGWPKDHIGRSQGTAMRDNGGRDLAYTEKPVLPWSLDMKCPVLFGTHDPGLRGTQDFRSSRHHIREATLRSGPEHMLTVLSDGTHSVRFELAPDPDAIIDDRDAAIVYRGNWHVQHDPRHLGGTETVSFTAGDTATCQFNGTGLVWIGSADVINGLARVTVDGVVLEDRVNLRVAGPEFAGSSIGFDKKFQQLQYAVTGLEDGPHTVCIEVTGERGPEATDCVVGIDALRVLRDQADDVRLHVIQNYNYPRLAWGNFLRPAVLIGTGSQATAWIQLSD
ncbi:MAG: glycoside hydrolase family 2 TIM barrel-domain containing protein [Eubacteriales bacterium]|nr:glycoside hydrolase family 2 TIM barrel-domain containing protein [Eubacteriales bacterium]